MRAEPPGMRRARNKDTQEISATKSWIRVLIKEAQEAGGERKHGKRCLRWSAEEEIMQT